MEYFSKKIIEAVNSTLNDDIGDVGSVVYDLSTRSQFGRNYKENEKFKTFINNITTTHPDKDMKLVYIGRNDFNYLLASDTASEQPMIVLSMPFSTTYVFQYTSDSTSDSNNRINFIYINKYKATHRYKKE